VLAENWKNPEKSHSYRMIGKTPKGKKNGMAT
jgi:hypothetical protein